MVPILLVKKKIQSFSVNHNITWKLNTPAAPWTGGFFERMIKSVKRLLRKMLYRRKVSYDEMLTILSDVENIVNNRPLTFIYEELKGEGNKNMKFLTNVPFMLYQQYLLLITL